MNIPNEAIDKLNKRTENAYHAIAGVIADEYGVSRDDLIQAALEAALEEELNQGETE